MFYLLGLAIFLVSFGLTVTVLGGDISYYLNIPTLLIIIVPLAAILTATQNFKIFGAGFKAAIFPNEQISEDLRGKAASLFRFLSKTTALVAALGTMISFLNMLMNLNFDDPYAIQNLGANIAAALVSIAYGLVLIAAVFEPIVIILKKRSDKDRERK